jgi:nicotinamidase-related amidase
MPSAPAPRRALIVIDVQNEYVNGALPIAHPPLDTSLPNIAAALAAASESDVSVVLVQHVDEADSPVFAAGSQGAVLHDTVASAPRAALVTKQFVSAFVDTDLAERLAALSIDTVTLVGFMTQHCIDSTARDAADRGLAVEVLSDATGTLPLETPSGSITARELHEHALIALHAGFASVVTTADWLSAVADGVSIAPADLWASTESARAGLSAAAAAPNA